MSWFNLTFREAWNGRFKGGEGYAKWQEYQINKKMLLSSRHFSLYKDTHTENKSSLIPSCYVGSCKRFVQHGSRTNAKRRPYPQMLCQNRFLQTFRFKLNQCRSLRCTYMPLSRWKINSFSPLYSRDQKNEKSSLLFNLGCDLCRLLCRIFKHTYYYPTNPPRSLFRFGASQKREFF